MTHLLRLSQNDPWRARGTQERSKPISMSELPFKFIDLEKRDELAVLKVDDAPANTLTYDLLQQLEDTFFQISLDPGIRAVVVTGAGERFFCGGVNIGMLRSSNAHFNSNFLLYASEVFELIDRAPQLVVAAINGHITGGGLELALIADRRVAVRGTYNFGFPEVRLGVIPGMGGTQRLAKLIGTRQALELITHGEFISVERAHQLGIVEAVFPRGQFLEAALEYTRRELRELSPPVSPAPPGSPWQPPSESLVLYSRKDRIGVISVLKVCSERPALQVLWALNAAILKARIDQAVDAVLIEHEAERLQLGRASSIDDFIWHYAHFVFSRLENYPRLCALYLSGGADALGTELALACDYRLGPQRKSASDTLLTVSPSSSRYARYLPPRTAVPARTEHITYAAALEQGLLKLSGEEASIQAGLKWMARFVAPGGASKAIGYAKLSIVKSVSLQHEAGALLERHLQEQLFRGHDGPEGMRAYLEKRAAVFEGY